ncbi:hypothetical protein R3W88_024229 [Solanum pinnatisectum]|uniref:Uncharacterized protein n=1 Tax=Solanum pinnatisectum TaxID=50273 RepID=A0AAV9M007_9SOLN|nr:hypothetical protein R3W88_024229 [Solanum pinnatisectum]
MFGISCYGIMAPSKNCWPSDCDVSYDQAKRELVLDPSKLIPSHFGPKDLRFESRVIVRIVATTLLPRAGSHSTLTQNDTLFVYCLVFVLPFGMLLTRIFEYRYMCLSDFSPVFSKQCYNSRSFQRMGFVQSGSSWFLKTNFDELGAKQEKSKPSASTSVSTAKLSVALENLDAMHAKLDAMSIIISKVSDVDSLKDLLLAAHFKIDNVNDVSKEIGADVAKISLRLDQILKEAIKIATKVQAGSKAISTSLSSKLEEMSTAIINSLTYFLRPR